MRSLMTDETDFTPKPGDVVLDRDDDDPDPAVVANAPSIPAEDWPIPWLEKTIAEDNPDYPADAPIALVVYENHLEENEEALLEWDRENAVAISELTESSLSYYVFPQPRLHSAETGPESGTKSSESNDDEGAAYAERLEDAGVAVEHVNYDGMIHDFVNMRKLKDPYPDIARADDALDQAGAALHNALKE
jgi:hypothetical protein